MNPEHFTGWTKSGLAAHIFQPHLQADGTTMRHALPVSEMEKWSKEELTNAHFSLHEKVTVASSQESRS